MLIESERAGTSMRLYSRRVLYPMLPKALDSKMIRPKEVSFAKHTLVLYVHVHASLLCLL